MTGPKDPFGARDGDDDDSRSSDSQFGSWPPPGREQQSDQPGEQAPYGVLLGRQVVAHVSHILRGSGGRWWRVTPGWADLAVAPIPASCLGGRIVEAAAGFGAPVLMTDASHASGTDRIAEVARRRAWPGDAIVVNLQGDEPAMPPELVDQVAGLLAAHEGADLATLAAPVSGLEEYLDPNVVKVVTDAAGRALYFSRAPIPWCRDGAAADSPRRHEAARRHVGLYAYRVEALLRLAALPVAPLEDAEKLEQLRALHHGMEIRVADAACRPGPDVNTAQDLARARAALGAGTD